MSSWPDLAAELARWRAAGRVPRFWWRDDDAVAPSAALDRLLAIVAAQRLSPALAVIPACAAPALAERLNGQPIALLQHGYAHQNHAPPGEKKAELAAHRPVPNMLAELRRGAERLAALFGANTRVLVPPWNRIDARLVEALPAGGFTGLSSYRPRPTAHPTRGLTMVNCHVDIVDWRERRFVGEATALGLALGHLAARRAGLADPDEPTGLLTHHALNEPEAWRFVETLVDNVRAGGGYWIAADELFAAPS